VLPCECVTLSPMIGLKGTIAASWRRQGLALICLLGIFGASGSAHAQTVLPFTEDWESTGGETYASTTASLTGAPEWGFTPVQSGARLRLAAGPGFYASGVRAATLDRDALSTTNVAGHITLTLDMTNYNANSDSVVLDFKHAQHGDEASPGDRVWVRGSSSDNFIELFNLTIGQPISGTFKSVIDVDVSTALKNASQQFSSTFQLRFGQEDNFDATSPTGIDGRTFDDIVLRRVLNNDVAIEAVTTPVDMACGESMQDVTVSVVNSGALPQSNIPVSVVVSGDISTTLMATIPGPLAKNAKTSIVVGQINTYPGVTIGLDASVTPVTDEDPLNNTLSVTRTSRPTLITIDTPPADVCPGETATIGVQTEPLASFELYDIKAAGMLLSSGNTLTTPPVFQNTSFWVERVNAGFSGGAVDNVFGKGADYGSFDHGLVFDTSQPVIVQRVFVYPAATGTVVVSIYDSGQKLLGQTAPYQVKPTEVGMKTEIDVGISIPVGSNFVMTAEGSSTPLYRNYEGAMYPYDINQWVSITGNVPNISSAYYFFYDWLISEDVKVCGDERTEVVVKTDDSLCDIDLVAAGSGPAKAAPGDTLEYVWTVENKGTSLALATGLDVPAVPGLTFVSNTGDCDVDFPCSFGDLEAAATRTVTTTYTVDADAMGALMVVANATSTSQDSKPGDESATVTTTVDTPNMTSGAGGSSSGGGDAGGSSGIGVGVGGGSASSAGGSTAPGPAAPAEENGSCGIASGVAPSAPWWLFALVFGGWRRRRETKAVRNEGKTNE
jgi:uncharacterized repeat protein (TIGR01451 family)